MKPSLILSIVCIFIWCCKNENHIKYELPPNPIHMIASDSTKVWKLAKRFNKGHRMNMGDCFLAFRMTFNQDKTMRDNNGLNKNCGKSIIGNWQITENEYSHYIKISSPAIPELLQKKDTSMHYKTMQLSDTLMILEFNHKQFSDRTTTIRDHYVPENKYILGRDFHY